MATRKENAEALSRALGVSIDTDRPEPKAAQLQDWADRLEKDPEGVKREALSFQLQAFLGHDLPSPDYTTEQLASFMGRSLTDPEALRLELQPLDPSTLEIEKGDRFEPGEETFAVQVVPAVAAYGGTVTDPEQPEGHRVIGGEPVRVRVSQIVGVSLKNGTLLKV